MEKRLKIISIFALSGFLLGVAANLIYVNVVPVLARLFPQIVVTTWILWGLIGAFISVAGCLLYAFLPER